MIRRPLPTQRSPGDDLQYGSDVEFFIEYNGLPAPAEMVLPFQGMIGTDNHGHSRGMRDTAEIRTQTSKNVEDLVYDIARSLNVLYDHLTRTPSGRTRHLPLLFLTGHSHHGRAIGGHVHFSSLWYSPTTYQATLLLLHGWATAFMARYDDQAQMRRREQAGYLPTRPEDSVRLKSSQLGIELFHWEFRQWGSFLVSPLYCYTVLALSKLIALNVLRAPSEEAIIALPRGEHFAARPERVEYILSLFPIWEPDLERLPATFRELESTRTEIGERWNTDFMELWRDEPSDLEI